MLGKINSWNIGKVKATKIVEIDRIGDFLHYSCKMEKLDWITSMDWNPELAKDTRKEKLLKYANEEILFSGTHFAIPSAGFVRKKMIILFLKFNTL